MAERLRLSLIPATRLAFMVPGYAISAWAPLIPHVQSKIGLSAGALGLTLLAMGLGSMSTMPFAGGLLGRFGCRRLFTIAGGIVVAILPCLALAPSAPTLALALFVLGAGLGLISAARNLHGIATERALDRRLMSGFHGFYSIGCVLGAGTMSILMGSGVPPVLAISVVALAIVIALFVSAPWITDERSAAGPAYARPRGVVLVIGLLCFVVFMVEGSVLDWSAILLTGHFHLDPARAGLGYVAFATTMTVGRLTGDGLVRRFGDRVMLSLGPLLGTVGFLIAILPVHWTLAVAGFALVGAGCANVVPLLYSVVGRQTIMPRNLALTAAGSIGFAGVLTGPAAIGFVAQWTSLSLAFLILAGLLLLVARAAPKVLAEG
ncbi:MFS transporter [Sphingomonas sp. BIUV-7]|uniref:MFS transporter n=1 Tax=Sphingomonas natans TaxID=3063330 RepID=A0ABT8Y783_9SPHN|nr:MFS transporter [Sphingomonas sp. BIUV-7]MDO6413594.1 MFS transporter [Sphingomonas sp. BIUV-7]